MLPALRARQVSAPGQYFAPSIFPGASPSPRNPAPIQPSRHRRLSPSARGAAPAFSATDPLEPTLPRKARCSRTCIFPARIFSSTTKVLVGGVVIPAANVIVFINGTLIRATIPAAQLAHAGNISISLQSQSGALNSGTLNLQVSPVRPGLIASAPDSVQESNGGASLTVSLTGGYFVPNKTTATFDGLGCGGGGQVCTNFVDSRHLTVSIQDASLTSPGLYPLIVQNADAAHGGLCPRFTGLNLAVTPDPASDFSSAGPRQSLSGQDPRRWRWMKPTASRS